jgi:hypothetical protein
MVMIFGKNSRRKRCEDMFKSIPEGKRLVGKPGNRWLGDVENDLKEVGVSGWTKYLRTETSGN